MTRRLLTGLIAALLAAPVGAVGLGPLSKTGVIDGPSQAFYLTLLNPYETATEFRLYPVGQEDEESQARVDVFPYAPVLASRATRQILVIANGLAVGETYQFRVCAERATPPQGIAINARVCSKLSARRIA
ncbi:hypothetical protein ABC347_08620 [Sphingomonas sp. 1P06PA]|uniref:hypothetical protein n=1 Tax=Sphingomonas sp. 1P06PA TaxID=554121 RepID=UPI0039A5B6A8